MAKTIVITGTSSGIGYGATQAFAEKGYRVIATVRSQADADRLSRELGSNVHPVICDVTNAEHVAQLPEHVKRISENEMLDGLINNAGILIGAGPVEFQKMADIRAQFEVNVFGLIAVTHALLPLLKASPNHRAGRIINISSIGGGIAQPFIAPYVATKHAVEGFSHSLRRELRMLGIGVIIVGPGPIKTEIWNKNKDIFSNPFKRTVYGPPIDKFISYFGKMEPRGSTPQEIGGFLVKIFDQSKPRPRYTFTSDRFVNWTLPYLLPHSWLDGLFGMMIGLTIPKGAD